MKTPIIPALGSIALLAAGAQAATVIGLNITDGWSTPMLAGETADGSSNWTDSMGDMGGGGTNPQLGTITLAGSSVTVTWNSSNTWAAGNEGTSEQQLYRVYLDDGDGGSSLVNGDGIGVSVTISGLGAWLTAEGKASYQVRLYTSTDWDNASFQPASIRLGAPNPEDGGAQLTNLTVAETVPITARGPGDYPPNTTPDPTLGIWQSRGYGDSVATLTADTITLTIPVLGGGARGTLSGFKITAVPEPATAGLLALGLIPWLAARRRKA